MTKNMKKQFKFIFDMDGTLYQFDKGKSKTFDESSFYLNLKKNVILFLMTKKKINEKDALIEYKRLYEKYKGQISLGVKFEHNINILEFFKNTWNMNPSKYIEKNNELKILLNPFTGKVALLTNAPRIWTTKVIQYLELEEIFKNMIHTGEPIIRKPNPLIFQKIAKKFNVNNSQIISIGDQEETEIIPAKSIGMKTLFIGQGATSADYSAINLKEAIILIKKEGFL